MSEFSKIFYILIFFTVFETVLTVCVRSQTKTCGGFIFMDVNCTSLDTTYLNFTKCLVRKNNYNKNVLDLYVKLVPNTLTNITVNI